MKYIFQGIIKCVFILLGSIFLGFALLCIVHLLPIDKMHQNAKGSSDVLQSYGEVVTGYKSTALDNYTDSIMINQAICPIEAPLIDKVINNYQVNYNRGYEQPENLICYLNGEEGYQFQGYSHYWGGWLLVVKPLLLVFDFSDIKVLSLILQAACMLFVVLGLMNRGKKQIILPFFVAVMTLMPQAIALSLQLCDVYYITMLGMIALLWKYEKIEKAGIIYFFLLLGIATSYFDFLTYPFLSCGMPMVVWLVLNKDSFIKKGFQLILNSIMWCVGYVGMWGGKWILSSILLPQANAWQSALRSIFYRGSNYSSEGSITMWDALIKNLYVYLRRPTLILIGLAAIYLIIVSIKTWNNWKGKLPETVLYGATALYPIFWYTIATNHSYEHAFMSYRTLGIMTFAGLSLLAQWKEKEE